MEALAELEQKLFGIHRPCVQEQRVTDRTHIPIKSGVPGIKFLKSGPLHILENDEFEPLYAP